MKQRKITKKAMAFLLTVAMIVTSFPFLSHEVYAADNVSPDNRQFATVEQLRSFNTATDGNSEKVYFGKDRQQWWIAGSQNGNLTLFARSPLATEQKFEQPNIWEKGYKSEWNCTYPTGAPTNVNVSHYGGSPLRTTLRDLEKSYFTSSEQALMNETTIYTNDTKNSKNYFTREKLYLAYGNLWDTYITVGTNSVNSLNNGLRIDRDYWGYSAFFLRAPSTNGQQGVLVGWPGNSVLNYYVSDARAVVPAFELNLSSVLFASAAQAASNNGALYIDDGFTLRYQPQTSIGTATISKAKQSVAVTGITNENTYLVVQNKDSAWSKRVSNNDIILANEVGLDNFANCKVWLETTSDRITYATYATQGNNHNIKINVGDTINVLSGNLVQIGVTGEITPITIQADSGYYFPDEYVEQLKNQLNSLTVTKTDNYNLKISGTPTSDVYLTLSATRRPKADTPEITTTQTASSITVNELTETDKYGAAEYSMDNQNWQDSNVFENLSANTEYTVFARYKGNDIYMPSEAGTIRASTAPATYEITIPMTAAADDSENTISIGDTDNFDLGYNGKVNVKIKDTDTMNNGVLSLIRENGNNETITSQLLVGGNPFTDLSQNVATFTNKNDKAIPFVFKRPTNTNILAGTYKGTVIFDISYSEN